jgi:hypothetical protein
VQNDLRVSSKMTASLKTKEVGAQPVSKETIRALATAESFARGRTYLTTELSPICVGAMTN